MKKVLGFVVIFVIGFVIGGTVLMNAEHKTTITQYDSDVIAVYENLMNSR